MRKRHVPNSVIVSGRRRYPSCAKKQVFITQTLQVKRTEIEDTYEFAKAWDWNENPRTCKIGISYTNYGLNDEEHWDKAIDFLANSVAELVKVFKPLIDTIARN